jgi:hypothetical protein
MHALAVPQIREQYAELRDEFYAGLEDRKYVLILVTAACIVWACLTW